MIVVTLSKVLSQHTIRKGAQLQEIYSSYNMAAYRKPNHKRVLFMLFIRQPNYMYCNCVYTLFVFRMFFDIFFCCVCHELEEHNQETFVGGVIV